MQGRHYVDVTLVDRDLMQIIMMVTDGLAPNSRQVSKNHDDLIIIGRRPHTYGENSCAGIEQTVVDDQMVLYTHEYNVERVMKFQCRKQ